MLGKRFLFQGRKKYYFLLKFQFKMKKCKVLSVFLQNYGYENKEVQTFWLKIINIIFFE